MGDEQRLDFRLYLITDKRLITHHVSLITAVREALKGGVRAIQLREKDLDTRELLRLAYKMRELTRRYNARLFINDRLDIALAIGADGVHLTQKSVPVEAVRLSIDASRFTHHASRLLVGVSTHSLKEAKDAERGGADFITFGPVYRTPSKLRYGPPQGVDRLREVCQRMNIPVFAIGGIKAGRIKRVMKAGAYGVAMISEIFGAEDIRSKAKEIMNLTKKGMNYD
jgi:thiamine-phosphate pyrophosphorylase